ncbi:hypothetical protein Tco_0986680 [Tanacetum coccineum]
MVKNVVKQEVVIGKYGYIQPFTEYSGSKQCVALFIPRGLVRKGSSGGGGGNGGGSGGGGNGGGVFLVIKFCFGVSK